MRNTLKNPLITMRDFTVALFFILASTVAFIPVPNAQATNEAFTTPVNVNGAPATPIAINGLSITGAGDDMLAITIYASTGAFTLGTTTGITVTGASTNNLQMKGLRSALNASLATLQYANPTVGTYEIQVVIGGDNGEVYNFTNGHVYQIISTPGSWHSAKTGAESLTYQGAQGYLVTLTSAEEHNFVKERLNTDGWIGASDSETEGEWKWVGGPEQDQLFYSKNYPSNPQVIGKYSGWNTSTGEPNNGNVIYEYQTGEDCALIWFKDGANGNWNDYICSDATAVGAYVVEYGAPGALPTVKNTKFNVAVTNTPIDYSDKDGVDNAVEAAAPNNGDANNDGKKDNEQANVASFVSTVTDEYVSIELPADCTITAVGTSPEDVSVADGGYNYEAGLVNFDADCVSSSVAVKIYQYGIATENKVLRKFNPTANSNNYRTIEATLSDTIIGGLPVAIATYTIVDNGELDLNPVTGKISDPVGLASVYTAPPQNNNNNPVTPPATAQPQPKVPMVSAPLSPDTGIHRSTEKTPLAIAVISAYIVFATTALYAVTTMLRRSK